MTEDSHDDDRSTDVGDVDVIHETDDDYVVIYPNGENDVLPKNQENRLMIEYDAYDLLHGDGSESFAPHDHNVTLTGTGQDGIFLLDVDDDRVQTTLNDRKSVVRALRQDLDAREAQERLDAAPNGAADTDVEDIPEPGEELFSLYQRIIANRVRTNVVEEFRYWFPTDRIEITDSGWIVDDTFIVNYEAENYSLDDVSTHKIQGGSVVEVDEEHQFVELEPSVPYETEAFDVPGEGDTQVLSEREQFFLATVQKFIDSESSDGGRFAAAVRREKRRVNDEAQTADAIVDLANSMRITAFRDDKTGLVHRHGIGKHTLRANFSVTQDVIDVLHYNEFDHAGVHELLARHDELEEMAESDEDFEIFSDVDPDEDPDQYEARWDEIDKISERAIIPDLIHNEIQTRFA